MPRFNIHAALEVKGGKAAIRTISSVGSASKRAGRQVTGLAGKVGGQLNREVGRVSPLAAAAAAGLAAMAARSIAQKVGEQQQAVAQLNASLESTGHAAGFTSRELQSMASDLQGVLAFGDEEILRMQSQLLTFTNIADQEFSRTTQAVLDLSVKMDQDLRSSVVQLGKALNDPVSNLGALGRAGIQFSDAQKAVIKDLASTNRLAEAQGIILDELEKQFGGAARAARDTLPGALQALGNEWGDLQEKVGQSSGSVRTSIEGMVKGLRWLNANWAVLESAVLETVGEIAGGVVGMGGRVLGAFASMREGLEDFVDFLTQKLPGPLRDFLNLESIEIDSAELREQSDALLQLAEDIRVGFEDKAASALDRMGQAAEGAGAAAANVPPPDAPQKLDDYGKAAKSAAEELEDLTAELAALQDAGEGELELIEIAQEFDVPLDQWRAMRDVLEEIALQRERIAMAQFDPFADQEFVDQWAELMGGSGGAGERTVNADLIIDPEAEARAEDLRDAIGEVDEEIDRVKRSSEQWSGVWEQVAADMVSAMLDGLQKIVDGSADASEVAADLFVLAFQAAGAAIGSAYGPAGAAIGGAIGGLFGGILGGSIFGGERDPTVGAFGTGETETFGNGILETQAMEEELRRLEDELANLETQFGFTVSGLSNIRVVVKESGEAAVEINGEVRAVFATVDEARDYAARLAVAFGDVVGGVGQFVEWLQLAANQAESSGEFNRAVSALREIMEVELGDTGTAVFDAIGHFRELTRALQEVGLTGEQAGKVLGRDLAAIRRDITGASLSAREMFEMRRTEYNRELEREKERQQRLRAEAQAALAAAEADIARIASTVSLTEAQLTAAEIDGEVAQRLTEAQLQTLEAANAALFAAQQQLAEANAFLENMPDPIRADEFRDPRAGQRQSDRERLAVTLDRERLELEGASDLSIALFELEEQGKEWAERAHGSAELLAEVAELLADLEQSARDAAVRGAYDPLLEFEQDPIRAGVFDPLRGLQEQREGMREVFQQLADDLGFSQERLDRIFGRIDAAFERHLEVLSAQTFVELGESLAGLVQDEELRQQLITDLENIRFDLEMAHYQAQFEMLVAMGQLTAEQIAMFEAAFDNIREHRDEIVQGRIDAAIGRGRATYSRRVTGSTREEDPFAEARKLLEKYEEIAEDVGLSEGERKLRQIHEDFETIFDAFGRNTRTLSAFRGALEDLYDSLSEPLRELREDLLLGDETILGPRDQFSRALEAMRGLGSAALGGDVSAIEEFPEALQRVLGLAQELSGGGGLYATVFREGNALLQELLNLDPEILNTGDETDPAQAALLGAAEDHHRELVQVLRDGESSASSRESVTQRRIEGVRDEVERLRRGVETNTGQLSRVANALEDAVLDRRTGTGG